MDEATKALYELTKEINENVAKSVESLADDLAAKAETSPTDEGCWAVRRVAEAVRAWAQRIREDEMEEEKKPKASWDEYFMGIATQAATRASCDRKHVGAVIVKNKTILSTGYNGSPRGLPHCDDVGHELKDLGGRQSCVRTVHAEANAIAQAARTGAALEGAVLYTTASPCYDCAKLLINAGISKVVCLEFYGSRYGVSGEMEELLRGAGVEMTFLGQDKK